MKSRLPENQQQNGGPTPYCNNDGIFLVACCCLCVLSFSFIRWKYANNHLLYEGANFSSFFILLFDGSRRKKHVSQFDPRFPSQFMDSELG